MLFEFGVQLAKGGQREINDVVVWILTAGKHALTPFRDADDHEHLPVDADFFAQGIAVLEQLVRRVRAQDDQGCVTLVVNLGEPPS